MKYQDNLKKYDLAVNLLEDIQRKGKTMPYTSSNGYMFSLLNKDGQLGIRLSKEDRELFFTSYPDTPFMSHGAKMREYVLLPESLLDKPKSIAALIQKGYNYVNTLKPK